MEDGEAAKLNSRNGRRLEEPKQLDFIDFADSSPMCQQKSFQSLEPAVNPAPFRRARAPLFRGLRLDFPRSDGEFSM
jgi:hypothetical protein